MSMASSLQLQTGTMPMPGAGDCWYCALAKQDGTPMGDAMDTLHSDGRMTVEVNTDHLFVPHGGEVLRAEPRGQRSA